MQAKDIRWIHVELSSKCNAWCPECRRNNKGFGLAEDLVEQDLPTSRLIEVVEQLPNLEVLQLCGNYGDPLAAHNINDVVDYAVSKNVKIQIHTNGSLRNTTWWSSLGQQLKDYKHDVCFGIDGLEGTHEIYRQGTSFTKIIDNAKAFIQSGGYATWQFIPYAHNEHQTKDCFKMSHQLGFKKFKLADFSRTPISTPVHHYKTGAVFELKPPQQKLMFMMKPISKTKTSMAVDPKDCVYLNIPSVYLAANGKLNTCCHYGFPEFQQYDTLNEVFDQPVDLTRTKCITACGFVQSQM